MKGLIWGATLLLALLWTALLAATGAVGQWLAERLAAGEAQAWSRAVADLPLPGWLALWIDRGLAEMLRDALVGLLEALGPSAGVVSALLGWLTPLLVAVWLLGVALLLVLALVLHRLVAVARPGRPGVR